MDNEYTEGWDDNFAASTSTDERNDEFNDETDKEVESIDVDETNQEQYNDKNYNNNNSTNVNAENSEEELDFNNNDVYKRHEAWGETVNDSWHDVDAVQDETSCEPVFSQQSLQEDYHEELLEEEEEEEEWQQTQEEEESHLSQEPHRNNNNSENKLQKSIDNVLQNHQEVMTKPYSQNFTPAQNISYSAKAQVNTSPASTVLLQKELIAKDRVDKPLSMSDELEQVQELLNCFEMALPTNIFDEQLRKVLHLV